MSFFFLLEIFTKMKNKNPTEQTHRPPNAHPYIRWAEFHLILSHCVQLDLRPSNFKSCLLQLDANTQRTRKVYVPIFQLNGFSQEREFSFRDNPRITWLRQIEKMSVPEGVQKIQTYLEKVTGVSLFTFILVSQLY